MPNPRLVENYTPGKDDSDNESNTELRDFESSHVGPVEEGQHEQDSYDDEDDEEQQQRHRPPSSPSPQSPPLEQLPSELTSNRISSQGLPKEIVTFPSDPQQQQQQQQQLGRAPPEHATREYGQDAPPSNRTAANKSWLFWTLVAVVVLLLVLAAVAINVMVIAFRDDDNNNGNQSNNNDRAFGSHQELLQAVDLYLTRGGNRAVADRYGPIETWDVQQVTNMAQLFDARRITTNNNNDGALRTAMATFNADLSRWDVSRVTNFYAMFQGAATFNADISEWQVRQAHDFSYTFAGAKAFNQDLSAWDMRRTTTILSMFQDATSFNQNVDAWELNSLETMASAFQGATSFAQDLCPWSEHWGEGGGGGGRPITTRVIAALDAFIDTACPVADTQIDWTSNPPSPLCFTCQTGYECFTNRQALLEAVDEFALGQNLAAERYGPDIGQWCVGAVTDFSQLFSGNRNPRLREFNQDVSNWDMSSAVSLQSMFENAVAFNQPLGSWDVSSVTNMEFFLASATSFNQNLCPWGDLLDPNVDTTNAFVGTACPSAEGVVDLSGLYPGPFCVSCTPPTMAPMTQLTPSKGSVCFQNGVELAAAVDDYLSHPSGGLTRARYGHPIGNWCVSGVTDFSNLFDVERNPLALNFNEDISAWDTSNSEDMFLMFAGAEQFNQDLSGWQTSRVFDFGGMFNNCTSFNGNISTWDTSNALNMGFMFNNAVSFDQDLSRWDVSNVLSFRAMFQYAEAFSADLSEWDVSSSINFGNMFLLASSFSSDLSRWDVSQASSLRAMFAQAERFDSDVSQWDVSRVTNFYGTFAFLPLFNSDISQWNVSRAEDMGLMFFSSSEFSQDLCPWGSTLSPDTVFEDTFVDTNCPAVDNPDFVADPPGPFCLQCRR
eukprot:scaffold5215_cov181-Amphora_coffeaeformis.AAC.19